MPSHAPFGFKIHDTYKLRLVNAQIQWACTACLRIYESTWSSKPIYRPIPQSIALVFQVRISPVVISPHIKVCLVTSSKSRTHFYQCMCKCKFVMILLSPLIMNFIFLRNIVARYLCETFLALNEICRLSLSKLRRPNLRGKWLKSISIYCLVKTNEASIRDEKFEHFLLQAKQITCSQQLANEWWKQMLMKNLQFYL